MYRINSERKFVVLETMGVPYVMVEFGGETYLHFSKVGAKRLIDDAVKAGQLDADSATSLLGEIQAKDLLESDDLVRERLAEYKFDADRAWEFSFEPCHSCATPWPHGHIVNRDGRSMVQGGVHTLFDGMLAVEGQVDACHIDEQTASRLLQQMAAHNLAVNSNEKKARYDALPAEAREAYEADMRQHQAEMERLLRERLGPLADIMLGGGVEVIEL